MAHPRTFAEFLAEGGKLIESEEPVVQLQCISCGEVYPSCLRTLTEGHCADCATEVFCGVASGAVSAVFDDNRHKAEVSYQAFKSMPEGQRYGMGKTSG